MGMIDIGIVVAFIVYAVVSGLRAKSVASQNLQEYFLAGRTLSGWKAGISMAATQFAADTPLLVAGLIATAGIFSLWRLWIYALAFLMMGFLLGAAWRRANVLTDAEFTEIRYSGTIATGLRVFKAIYFGIIFNCTVLAMVLYAATRIAEPFFPWSTWITILIIALVTLFYSTTGGLRSVVNTDLLQFGLAMVGTVAYVWFVIQQVGPMGLRDSLTFLFEKNGPAGMTVDQILAFTPSQAKDVSLVVLAVFGLQWIVQINADGTGYLAQRTMACRSDKDAKIAAVVFTFAQVLVRSLLWIPIGVGLLILLPPDTSLSLDVFKAEREASFVYGIKHLLPVGFMGLMLTALFAALASTLDTHLNWGSSYLTNDIYKRVICPKYLKREPKGRELVWIARGANILIFVLSLLIMTQLSSIQTAWQMSLLLGSGVGVMLVLRWIWWRITAKGELASLVTSFVLAPILILKIPADQEVLRLLIMALSATVVGIVVSLKGGSEPKTLLKDFYKRVKPPGFWKPIAKEARESTKEPLSKFIRGLGAMVTAAVSLFCLLVGIGTWMVDGTPPAWFPDTGLWVLALISFGLAITPLWILLGFSLPKKTD